MDASIGKGRQKEIQRMRRENSVLELIGPKKSSLGVQPLSLEDEQTSPAVDDRNRTKLGSLSWLILEARSPEMRELKKEGG